MVFAGDCNSPFIRNYIFVKGILNYPRLFDIPSPIISIASKKNVIEYIYDISTWKKTHEAIKEKVEKDNTFVEKLIDTTNELGEKFNEWSEKKIFLEDLSKLKNVHIVSLFKDFIEKQAELYTYGVILLVMLRL